MQYDRAFSYQVEDAAWPTKLGLGALISLVPILNFALVGYQVAILRNVASQAAEPLPHWDGFDRKFTDGLIITLAGLVYAAPMLIALAVPVALLFGSRTASRSNGLQDLSNALASVGGLLLACAVVVFIFYALILSIIRPAILVLFSRDGTFASCFNLREIVHIVRGHARLFFTTWVAVLLAGLGVGFVVSLVSALIGWIPCIGWLAAFLLGLGSTIYLITVEAHLFGQFRAEALQAVPTTWPENPAQSEQNPGDLSS